MVANVVRSLRDRTESGNTCRLRSQATLDIAPRRPRGSPAGPPERSGDAGGGNVVGWPGRPEGRPGRVSDKRLRHAGTNGETTFHCTKTSRERARLTPGTRMAQPLVPSGPGRPSGRPGHPAKL